jgi:hypothetical protein
MIYNRTLTADETVETFIYLANKTRNRLTTTGLISVIVQTTTLLDIA